MTQTTSSIPIGPLGSGDTEDDREIMVECRDVRMRFGTQEVLKGISFKVRQGETICILGGSGGGKTTLLKILIGAQRPTSGQVLLRGQDIGKATEAELDRIRRQFGVLFQSGALLNSLTVAENVALPLIYHTKSSKDVVSLIVKMKLESVNLREHRHKMPAEISGGMKKRAGIARAIALDPRIVFYDEPSAGLDPVATAEVDYLIRELKEKLGMTSVVVTHVMESVRRIADRIVMLDRGRVLLNGTLADFLAATEPKIVNFREGQVPDERDQVKKKQDYEKDLLMM